MNKGKQRRITLLLTICVMIVLVVSTQITGSKGATINGTKFQIKEGDLLGQTSVSLAQWDIEFDEDIYFWSPPPCARGLCRPEYQQQDECFPGCDWTLKGTQCGKAINSKCQATCDALKGVYCALEDWEVIQVDVESPVYTLVFRNMLHLRFNWKHVCLAFKVELIVSSGQVTFFGDTNFSDGFHFGTVPDRCYAANFPDPWVHLCPSSQCYGYGTHFLRFELGGEQGTADDFAIFSVIVRKFDVEPGDQRYTDSTVPADVPPSVPMRVGIPLGPNLTTHTPISFAVPVRVSLLANQAAAFFSLTSTYCGMVVIQHEVSDFLPQ